jgi:hypothetical protein
MAGWHQREQRARQEKGDGHPERAADERQQQAFGEELPHQSSARRAERKTDGDFSLAHEPAGDQQVGDVGARDQKNQADHAHQHDERGRKVIPQT